MMYVLGGNFILLRLKRVYYFRQCRSYLTVPFFFSLKRIDLYRSI